MANRLRRMYAPGEAEITVVDRDDVHVYQPGLLFVPFGLADAEHLARPRQRQFHRDVQYVQADIGHVDTAACEVHLGDGVALGYDVLIVATGARLVPEETEGMTGDGWLETVFPFYTPEGATALAGALERFEGGRLVVNVVDMPIKCPVAPLEFAFLADWYLTERGIRDRTELLYVTPLDGAFTKPAASQMLAGLLDAKDIGLVTEFNAGSSRRQPRDALQLRRARRAIRPARNGAPSRRRRMHRSLTRPRRRHGIHPHRPEHAAVEGGSRTSSRSATPPTCRRRRPDPSRISRRTRWRPTSSASSPGSRSRARSTVTPTASSRPAFTRPS